MTRPQRVAVVDLGSNSTRLFLSSGTRPGGPEGERRTVITGLRSGAGPDGTLTAEALARLDACLAGFAPLVTGFAPQRVLALGTSAVRDAPNRDAVAAVVRRHLAAPLLVLDGLKEARLSFCGARLALGDGAGAALVLDVGGGSTELVGGDEVGPWDAVSMDVGSVRTSERYLHHDPPTAAERTAMRGYALDEARTAVGRIGAVGAVIGVAGTLTSLVGIRDGGYDTRRVHRAMLTRREVDEITAAMGDLPLAARREVPGLEPGRAPWIVGGGLIVSAALEASDAERLMVSERDLLDGAVLLATELLKPEEAGK